jgi:hypothetical protein
MKQDVSNHTLIAFLVVAIIISVVGTYISLTKLGTLEKAGLITGYQTAQGNITLTLSQDTTITISPLSISFGSGYITNNSEWGILSTNASGKNYFNVTGFDNVTYGFNITNDGNIPLNITVQSDKNCSEFIGTETNCRFAFWMINMTATACNGTNQDTLLDFDETQQVVCDSLMPEPNQDKINVNLYLKIPEFAPSGAKLVQLTFNSAATG